jgi:hypothetical protein
MSWKKGKLVFANPEQVVLWNHEMAGQVSDGNWENSRPFDHWEDICGAEVSYSANPDDWGTQGFKPKRAYNFSSADLLEIVGDRALVAVQMAKAFPGISDKALDHSDQLVSKSDWDRLVEIAGRGDKYWVEMLDTLKTEIGLDDYEDIKFKLNDTLYDWADMVIDLRQMSEIIRKSFKGESQTTGKYSSPAIEKPKTNPLENRDILKSYDSDIEPGRKYYIVRNDDGELECTCPKGKLNQRCTHLDRFNKEREGIKETLQEKIKKLA